MVGPSEYNIPAVSRDSIRHGFRYIKFERRHFTKKNFKIFFQVSKITMIVVFIETRRCNRKAAFRFRDKRLWVFIIFFRVPVFESISPLAPNFHLATGVHITLSASVSRYSGQTWKTFTHPSTYDEVIKVRSYLSVTMFCVGLYNVKENGVVNVLKSLINVIFLTTEISSKFYCVQFSRCGMRSFLLWGHLKKVPDHSAKSVGLWQFPVAAAAQFSESLSAIWYIEETISCRQELLRRIREV